jgi:hypothetical protein
LTVAERGTMEAVARCFAETVRSEPAVRRLWAWSQRGYVEPKRDYVELWVLTGPVDDDAFGRLRAAGAGLHDRFPDANLGIHWLTPDVLHGQDAKKALRAGVEEIDLRPE